MNVSAFSLREISNPKKSVKFPLTNKQFYANLCPSVSFCICDYLCSLLFYINLPVTS
jgi:hypothetical protein